MNKDDILFLKEKAEKFEKYSAIFVKNKDYDFAAFHLEQNVQLSLKYSIALKLGDFPKIHPINILLTNLCDCAPEIKKNIEELIKKNENTIKNIDKAYLTSRYYPINFTEQEILSMLDFVNELKSILNILWNT